jgi:hypothetical protein
MKLAYKGFDKYLRCRGEQFVIGEIYSKNVELKTPKLCSGDGYHYCDKLEDVYKHYSERNNGNRFCEIQVLGAFTDDRDKSITTSFKILRELTKHDLIMSNLEKNTERMENNLHLETIQKIQQRYPMFHVGGSAGLFLHGARLNRWIDKNNSDLDLISPYFILVEDPEGEEGVVQQLDAKTSGNDFDETFLYDGVKVDYKIDPKQRYEYIEYKGFKYKVNPLFTILEAKMRYALSNQKKHKDDLVELISAGFVKAEPGKEKQTKTPNSESDQLPF